MKKIRLMLHHVEKEQFLKKLQEKGILHLEINEKNISAESQHLIEQREKLLKAISILSNYSGEVAKNDEQDAHKLADKTLELTSEIEKYENLKESLKKELDVLEPWGDFEGDYIKKLARQGINIKFYIASKKVFQSYDFEGVPHALISIKNGMYYFVVFDEQELQVPFDTAHLPKKRGREIRQEIVGIDKKTVELNTTLKSYAKNKWVLDKKVLELNDGIMYHQTSSSFSLAGENVIHHIQGWIPEKDLNAITNFLDEHKIAYLLSDPSPNEDVPIVLKNNKYPKVFEAITNIFELPNYRELDLTPVIAVFYPVFFAYCLGDSGYGLIFVILFSIGYFTFLKENKVIAALGAILGLFTMVIGIVKSGTILGIPITTQRDIAFFDFFAQFTIIPETGNSPFNAFNVALILGIVQIIVGVTAAILRAWIYESFEASLASIGKLFIIVCTVVIFLGSAQGVEPFVPFLAIAKYGLIAGIALVLLFNNIRLPIIKRIGSGVLPLYFIFTGLLGDTLSYIRLFALGISSGILGLVINNIGNQIMSGGMVGIVIGVIFLILGHALNLFISGLGSFVHPLRLTFVEFYNNAGFQGGGIPFKPFKKEALDIKQEQ